MLIDTEERELTLVNAGHPNGLLRTIDKAEFLHCPIGPPIGVSNRSEYASTVLKVPPESILIGFTDGLIERRGESINVSLARIQLLMAEVDLKNSLDDIVSGLVSALTPSGPADDIAILGLRWN